MGVFVDYYCTDHGSNPTMNAFNLVDRGNCTFATKQQYSASAGYAGLVLVNNIPNQGARIMTGISDQIPLFMLSYERGQEIVNLMRHRVQAPDGSSIDLWDRLIYVETSARWDPSVSVPEPGTMALNVIGFALLVTYRRFVKQPKKS